MNKKILMGLGAALAVVASVAAMSAYEAHVINVTAHIENALAVHPEEIAFGTVFPQEYLEKQFTVAMSTSFEAADRVDDIEYVIKQKPKCECILWDTTPGDCSLGEHAPVNYATHECPEVLVGGDNSIYVEMLSLCPFLSKLDGDPGDNNDVGHPSYYVDPDEVPGNTDDHCVTPGADATGRLAKSEGDLLDLWIVDLKVPPVDGFVGQDWPAGCPTVADNDQDYGCDLWIEVTNISEYPY